MTDTKSNDEMATDQSEVEDFTDEPVEATQEPQDAPQEPEEEPEGDGKGGREAAKYRRRLRETEAERDALTEQVDALRRTVVDSIVTAAGRMPSAEALWAGGVEIDSLLDADGNIDRDSVLTASDEVAQRFGIRRRPRPNPAQTENCDPPIPPQQSMTEVVMGKTQR